MKSPISSSDHKSEKERKKREKKYGGVDITLANDAPRLVGISVVTYNLGGDHKCEEAVTRRALCGGEASLETL